MKFTQFPRIPLPALLLSTPALVMMLGCFIAPMILLGRVSLYAGGGSSGFGINSGGFYQPNTWTLNAYLNLFEDSYFWQVLTFSLLFGIGITLLTLLLAYPLALTIQELSPRLKAIALAAVILPKVANPLVIIYGIELLLSTTGPINQILLFLRLIPEPLSLFHNLTGAIIGEVYLLLPYPVLILVTAIDRIDKTLVPAAQGLGANTWVAFWRVTFPLSLPGLSLATILSLIFALGAFESPYLLGSPQEMTLAVDIQKQTFENLNWPRGAAQAIMMLVTLTLCIILYRLSSQLLKPMKP